MDFKLDTWLAISGIVVSVAFGIIGVYLAIRKKKYPGSISFILDQTFALVDDFAGRMSNLDITFNSKPLDKGVTLFTGYLVNDGSIDITSDMIAEPLQCHLPGNCQFLEIKVISKAKSLEVDALVLNSKTAVFNLGLFRRGESFSFQALVLLDEENTTKNVRTQLSNLTWYHRIANLGLVCTREIPEQKLKSQKGLWLRRIIGVASGLVYIAMGVGMVFSVGPLAEKPALHYIVESKGEYSFSPQADGEVKIKQIDSGETQVVMLEEFLEKNEVKPIISSEDKPVVFFLAMLFVLFGGGGFMLYTSLEKDYKLYKTNQLVKASKIEVLTYKEAELG